MKKVLAILALALTQLPAVAQYRYQGHHNHYHDNSGRWLAPLIVGGVVGYAISKNSSSTTEQVIVQQSVVTEPGAVVIQTQRCTAWQEVVRYDGSVLRQRTCTQ